MDWKKLGVIGVAALLGACATRSPTIVTEDIADFKPKISCGAAVAPEARVKLEMVDTLMARGRNYAALAQLQGDQQTSQEYWQRYGQLLVRTGDMERSEQLFTMLKDRCGAAEGWHGMGMVALKKGQLNTAIENFQMAVNGKPASSMIRNDYGYAQLLAGNYQEAALQLRTALELDNGKGRSRQNLAVTYLLSGDSKGLDILKTDFHFTDDELVYAKGLADQLRD